MSTLDRSAHCGQVGRVKLSKNLPLVLIGFSLLLGGCATSSGGGGSKTPTPVTGRDQNKTVSRNVMFAKGLKTFQSVTNKLPVVTGTPEAELVQRVGDRIRRAAIEYYASEGKPNHFDGFDWRFALVDEPRVKNAFAVPGGRVVVFTGMLPVTRDEPGLAALMGHEVAHAALEHANERMSRQFQLSGLFMGKAHSRLQEKEADEVGMVLMAWAAYDPAACKALWYRMHNSRAGQEVPYFESTHPADAQRIHNLGRLESSVRPIYEQAVRANFTFAQFEPDFAALNHFAGMAKGHNGGFTQLLATADFIERYKRNSDPNIASALNVLRRDLSNRTLSLAGAGEVPMVRAALDFSEDNAQGKAVAAWLETQHVKAWNFPDMREQVKSRQAALRTLAVAR